ncbi:hypothetical protein QN277_007484 [Acacia crassicarpa]|uniref:Cupin type-1 domain-containing protein n=1 Tax=Acacia crassicarpa TaxID=499986 RepID=A0AAE1MAI8_9FABA|nr:hypothetical protein QN277_007484 [Acacia crassicarpa]
MASRLPMLFLLGSVFLSMVSGHNAFSEKEKSQQQKQNPYLFRSQNFKTRFENQRGRIRILPRFDQRHPHLQGLQNYRLVELEIQPHSLFLPHHRDAENVLVVLEGKAIVSIVNQTNKETYNLEQGDVLRVRPGRLVYVANVEQNQKFRATSILIPVNIPGQYENLYPFGNQDPLSYYIAFSKKTLEATFNSKYNEIERILFGQKQQGEKGQEQSSNEGVMVKLSSEQARELRKHAESSSSSSSSPRRRRSPSSSPSSSRPIFNLRNVEPRYSNSYGNMWEVRPEDSPELLRDLDMSVAVLELKKGSLFLPHYNSKGILISQVIDGEAKLELASPHLANERSQEQGQENKHHEEEKQHDEEEKQEEQSEGQIRRVSSRLNQGDVFVALAGHPLALRASKKNDLWTVGFLLDADNNQRNFLGGEKDNVINQIDRIVLEQAVNGSGEEAEKLLNNQKESYFVNAQRSRSDEDQEEGSPLLSILEEESF